MARMTGKDAPEGYMPYQKKKIAGGIGGVVREAKAARARFLSGQSNAGVAKPAPVVGNRIVKTPPTNTGIVPPMMKSKRPTPQPVKKITSSSMNPAATMSTLSRKSKLTQR